MTEEQLAAAGWAPVPLSGTYQKAFGRATASLLPMTGEVWQSWAYSYLGIGTSLRAACERATGTLPWCVNYAEQHAIAIAAWLAGDEAGALDHARRAVELPADPAPASGTTPREKSLDNL